MNLGAFAGAAVAAEADTPLVQATPRSSAAVLIVPRSTLDLGLCTCDPSPHSLRLSVTGKYWRQKGSYSTALLQRYPLDQVVYKQLLDSN